MTQQESRQEESISTSNPIAKRAVVLLSGGLDSSTVLALALEQGYQVVALSFQYGQRHTIELERAAKIAQHFGVKHQIISINLGQWGGSSLTDSQQDIPTTATAAGVIPSTYVPGRNTVFIAVALSLAEAVSAGTVALGINAVDYSGYPDCRPEYLFAFQQLANVANKAALDGHPIQLWAPLVELSKVDIVQEAVRLGVPIDLTWSCYQGLHQPCGVCDSCRIRDVALLAAGHPELCS